MSKLKNCKAICKSTGKPCKFKTKNESGLCNKHSNQIECPICFTYFNNTKIIKLSCDHSFCKECILKWKKENNTCPYCRKLSIDKQNIYNIVQCEIYNFNNFSFSEKKYKFNNICKILHSDEGYKFLIKNLIFKEIYKFKLFEMKNQIQNDLFYKNSFIKKEFERWD